MISLPLSVVTVEVVEEAARPVKAPRTRSGSWAPSEEGVAEPPFPAEAAEEEIEGAALLAPCEEEVTERERVARRVAEPPRSPSPLVAAEGVRAESEKAEVAKQVGKEALEAIQRAPTAKIKARLEELVAPVAERLAMGGGAPGAGGDLGRRRVALCSCCLKRGYQAEVAIPCNLALMFDVPWVSLFLVIFQDEAGEWRDLCRFLAEHCCGAMKIGLLNVALCEHAHWHASSCKNTSHVFGINELLVERPLEGGGAPSESGVLRLSDIMCVNLDVDNILGGHAFFRSIADFLKVFRAWDMALFLMTFHGEGPGLTGRIAYSAAGFKKVCGYDEDRHSTTHVHSCSSARRRASLHLLTCACGYARFLHRLSVVGLGAQRGTRYRPQRSIACLPSATVRGSFSARFACHSHGAVHVCIVRRMAEPPDAVGRA